MSFTSEIRDFTKNLKLATADLSPQSIAKELASLARSSLSDVIRSGEGSERYDRYVNGHFGADENTVVAPGPILYDFHWWNEIIEYAISVLQDRSPVLSGLFKSSWMAMIDGAVTTDYADIPIAATVMIVNTQPYARKIEVGHTKMSVPHGVAEDSVLVVRRRFGNVAEIKKTMTTIPNGYILKGVFTKGGRKFSRTKLRRDTQAGSEMTYPALVISLRR